MATQLQKEVTAPHKESSTCWQQCQLPEPQTCGRWLLRPGHTELLPALAQLSLLGRCKASPGQAEPESEQLNGGFWGKAAHKASSTQQFLQFTDCNQIQVFSPQKLLPLVQ